MTWERNATPRRPLLGDIFYSELLGACGHFTDETKNAPNKPGRGMRTDSLPARNSSVRKGRCQHLFNQDHAVTAAGRDGRDPGEGGRDVALAAGIKAPSDDGTV